MNDVKSNLKNIRQRIESAAIKCSRNPKEITLVTVTKTVSADLIREAYSAGQKIFGESYAQELRDKSKEIKDLDISWHFIGHLQKNKAKYVANTASCWESLDSFETAEEMNRRASKSIDALIEVNLGGEEAKSGIKEREVKNLIAQLSHLSNIRLTGLMAIPPYDPDPEKSRPYFKRLKRLADELQLREISMGMSTDFEVAIEEGATILRIGTAIFGER